MRVYQLCDHHLQAALLIDNHHSREQHFLEDPHISVVFKQHCVPCLFQERLEDCPSVFITEISDILHKLSALERRAWQLLKDKLIEVIYAGAAV